MEKIQFSVVGSGIIGIMTALEIKRKCSGDVVLFERETFFGEHSSGRNSGVVHSGIYYKNKSLKHIHCMQGKKLWDELAVQFDIPLKKVGKFIFSHSHQELQLEELFRKGQTNGVSSLNYATPDQLDYINEFVSCSKAIWISDVAIIDQSEAMKALLREFESLGGIYLPQHNLSGLKSTDNGFDLAFENGLAVRSEYFINCGGLFGVEIRKKLNLLDLENYFVKGNYIKCTKALDGIRSLLYPLPEAKLKGLGIHLTLDMANNIRFGPNTEDVKSVEYSLNDESLDKMKEFVVSTYKNIEISDLHSDYCGVRSKILKDNILYEDFWIENPIKNYYECLGIESPGFTGAPSIAKAVVSRIYESEKI